MIEVFMLKIKELYWNRVIKTRDISFKFFNISQGGDNAGLSEYSRGVLDGQSGSEVTPV